MRDLAYNLPEVFYFLNVMVGCFLIILFVLIILSTDK